MKTSLQTFTEAYIEAMLWAEIGEDGTPLEDSYGPGDIDAKSMAEIKADCAGFLEANLADIEAAPFGHREGLERAGHDFYLTRNRHGAGFWDGPWGGEIGRRLTDAAHVYGTQGLMEAGDGTLYVHG